MVLLNEPQITLSLTCLYAQNSSVDGDVSSDAVTLRGHVVKDNGTDKVFYAIDPEGGNMRMKPNSLLLSPNACYYCRTKISIFGTKE